LLVWFWAVAVWVEVPLLGCLQGRRITRGRRVISAACVINTTHQVICSCSWCGCTTS
jgi:hypothetical protein